MHKTQESLAAELEKAAEKVIVGCFYCHYKNPDDTYKVLHLALTEWDTEICVVYEAQYGERLIFVRPLSDWLDEIEWENKTVNRFTLKK